MKTNQHPELTGFSSDTSPTMIEAENDTLAAMMVDNECIEAVRSIVCASDFVRHGNQILFTTIAALRDQNLPVDLLTLQDEMRKPSTLKFTDNKTQLEDVGGLQYLTSLMERLPSGYNAGYYAKIVLDKSLRRQMITLAHNVDSQIRDESNDPATVIDETVGKFVALIDNKTNPCNTEQAIKIYTQVMAESDKEVWNPEPREGITTRFQNLNDLIGPLEAGEVYIPAARPGMGKTTLAMDFAEYAACDQGKTVLFSSLEMSKKILMYRMISARAEVPMKDLREGRLSEKQFKFTETMKLQLEKAPLFLTDAGCRTLSGLRSACRKLQVTNGLDMLVVDYLQLMDIDDSKGKHREVVVSEITNGLKAIAMDFHIPVIALSQLSRAVESRDNKRPVLSDLRESGTIEQTASVILFLYRDSYYANAKKEDVKVDNHVPQETEIIIAKNRNGESNVTVTVDFIPFCAKFVPKILDTIPRSMVGFNDRSILDSEIPTGF